jgi:diguanylate cyclase (GGDEF)-like protein
MREERAGAAAPVDPPGPTTAPRPHLTAVLPVAPRCAAATTLDAACQGLADDLLDAGFDLPSVYLLTGTRLRCHAARGYFQVVDGFRPGTAVIGKVVQTGRASFLPDVREHPEFVAALPGVVAEACAPVRCHGEIVGAVNVESRSALPPQTPEVLAAAASVLGGVLERLGGLPQPSPAQRLAQIAVELSAAITVDDLERRALRAAVEISGMSSAAVVRLEDEVVSCATGPLASALRSLAGEDLQIMASWVRHGTSSHFPGGEQVPTGYEFLRRAGVRALSVHPLGAGGEVHGLLLLADAEPVAHAPSVVDLLELLAAQTGVSLGMAGLLHEVSRRAEQDDLTGLHNRHGFTSVLGSLLLRRRPGDDPTAVLLLDLDDFKHVNDSLGHHAGDRLLVQVAERLRSVLRADDIACRLGGDEFVVVLPGADEATAVAVAERMIDAVSSTWPGGGDLGTSASVGIALASGDHSSADSLLRAADLAMYLAKERGKGRCAVFEQHLQTAAVRRMALTRDLRRALRRDGLSLAYQPIVDLATGQVTAVEALARWDDPLHGPVSPAEFVPLAEQTGEIDELGAWVLRSACRQLAEWDAAGVAPDLAMCVNVSSRQLERGTLLDVVDASLTDGLDPARLVLEITETALAQDGGTAERTLHQLHARGIGLAVDDFGTGYSSLSRLRSAPVSSIKVDRTFVHEIDERTLDLPLVDATLALAVGLGLGVVAEGVETPAQLDYLRRAGCPHAQGYLLARPGPAEDLLPLLLERRALL